MQATHTPPTTAPADPGRAGERPSRLLRDAALYLRRHGWTQGSYYAHHNTPTPRACVMGALAMAVFGQPFPTAPYTQPEWADYKAAEDALLTHLDGIYLSAGDDSYPDPGLGDWNDQPPRTADQVIAALLAAADAYDHTHP
ncbi:MAG TPA: hypothetical protein VHN18_03545, partial [Micromonosporaceae bacterium]|nr:hypothetical protein [Micromonosporaceae bacterium]